MAAADPRALLAAVASDPLVFPHQLDLVLDRALLVRLDAQTLAGHSFLDQRALAPSMPAAWVPWTELVAAGQHVPAAAPAYIFHTGHCGSTLLSRLVAAATGSTALREPLVLRALAWDAAEGANAYLDGPERRARVELFGRLCCRGAPAVIKATSMATALAADVTGARVLLYQRPEIHLALILSGPSSLVDLKGFAPMRRKRLVNLGIETAPLARMRPGEIAAAAWLCEMATVASLPEGSAAAFDFDAFLAAPAPALQGVCRALGLDTDAAACEQAVTGPDMQRYSKAPEHPYNPGMRREAVDEGRRLYGDEIAAGLAWLEQAARARPLVQRVLDRFDRPATS